MITRAARRRGARDNFNSIMFYGGFAVLRLNVCAVAYVARRMARNNANIAAPNDPAIVKFVNARLKQTQREHFTSYDAGTHRQ